MAILANDQDPNNSETPNNSTPGNPPATTSPEKPDDCPSPPAQPHLQPVPSPVDGPYKFTILLRGLHEDRGSARTIEADAPATAISIALSATVGHINEPILTWTDPEKLVTLDFDRPEHAAPLTDADVPAFISDHSPRPIDAWTTHGAGLRLVFGELNGIAAIDLAGGWYLSADLGALADWPVEVKTDTRHPSGLRDGATCGTVFTYVPTTDLTLRRAGGLPDEAAIKEWLAARQLGFGRHATDACPWNPKTASGNPAVSITEWGLKCFHCGRSASWGELLGAAPGVVGDLYQPARSFVHFGHQQYVLRVMFPRAPGALLRAGWRHVLRTVNEDRLNAPSEEERARWLTRFRNAESPDALAIARASSGGWLNSRTLEPRKVSTDRTLKFLPSCFWPPMVDEADNAGPLTGYTPLHPLGSNEVVGPFVEPPPHAVFVRRPHSKKDPPPPDLSCAPAQVLVERSWAVIEAALPGVNRGYHSALVAAALVAQRGVGTPPMICATGMSGSAKTAQVMLAAGAVGTRAVSLALGATEDTLRRAGLALEQGGGILFADEVGRVDSVFAKLEPILAANSTLRYRPKYANERESPMRASIVLLGSTLPEAIVRSPELARRAVGYRLIGAEKEWILTDPTGAEARLDLSAVRRLDYLREAIDVVTASIWWRLVRLGPAGDWRKLALDEYGGLRLINLDLTDSDGEVRTKGIRDLYDSFRTAQVRVSRDRDRQDRRIVITRIAAS